MDDFLVIEGADYLGGRMRTVEFGGVTIEDGANFAQPGDAPVVNMILNKGMSCHSCDWESYVIYNATGYVNTVKGLEFGVKLFSFGKSWDCLFAEDDQIEYVCFTNLHE